MTEDIEDQDAADAAGAAAIREKMNLKVRQETDAFIESVLARAKDEPEFAKRLSEELVASKLVDIPSWLKPKNLFDATIDTGIGEIDITVVTFGQRVRTSLSTRMLRMQQALDASERKIAPLIDAGKSDEVDVGDLDKRNALIATLGIAQTVETLGSMITDGRGRFSKLNGLQDLLKRTDDNSFKTACSIVEDLPQKVIDMIGQAIRIMNNYAIGDKAGRGN